ncbi:hypothetical protein ABGV42_02100 [Paenibacillus pabuli]|uniref:hypothetical protein n=1 Tax=Paenibacillus pabuli TaxID=1472 RepID=UPI00324251B3
MSINEIAKDLTAKGQKAEVRDGKLFIDGIHIPVVAKEDQPYMSDCPNGVCNI